MWKQHEPKYTVEQLDHQYTLLDEKLKNICKVCGSGWIHNFSSMHCQITNYHNLMMKESENPLTGKLDEYKWELELWMYHTEKLIEEYVEDTKL